MQDVNLEVVVSAPPESVESDPTQRYWRFEKLLGSGACKTVFKAFDSREGIEVAWNKISLGSAAALSQDTNFRRRLFSEIHVLKRLQHKNIITFHDYWLDARSCTLNFITELFTHGSLKRFRSKHKLLELQVLKKWAWQIVQGLVYLHGHEPAIIHRDLKCDNIFINGVTGDLKIGDLGLATLWKGLAPLSVIGTPEFMAPEFYNENYDEKVDVYAFGMLLLELVSMDYPYCECTNPASIYKKVSQGIFPASIQKIRHPELKEFIELCIAFEPEKRPAARELLNHPFFNSVRKTMEPTDRSTMQSPETELTTTTAAATKTHSYASMSEANSSDVASIDQNEHLPASIHASSSSSPYSEHLHSDHLHSESEMDPIQDASTNDQVHIKIECVKVEDEPILNFSLEYQKPGENIQTIQFPFNIKEDTAEQIIREMRDESLNEMDLLITEEEASTIGHLIGEEVKKWRVKDEAQFEAYVNVQRRNQNFDSSFEIENSVKDSEDDVRLRLEAKVEDMCETMAAGQGSEHYFKALDLHSSAIMDCMDFTLRKPQKQRLSIGGDDPNSQAGLNEGQVLFSNPQLLDGKQMEVKEGVRDEGERMSPPSSAIDIPKTRRISSNFGQSMSSTHSESRFQHQMSESSGSPFGKTVFRRWSGKKFMTTEYQQPSSVGSHYKRSMSLALDPLTPISPSKQDLNTPEVSTEVSLIFLESAQPEGDVTGQSMRSGRSQDSRSKTEVSDQESGKTHMNNSSLISLVKVTPNTPIAGTMPTLHESTSEEKSKKSNCKIKHRKSTEVRSAKTKADEYVWRIANLPLVQDSEDTDEEGDSYGSNLTPEESPRSPVKYLESNPTASSTELVPQNGENNGTEKQKPSWGSSVLTNDLEPHPIHVSDDQQGSEFEDDHKSLRSGDHHRSLRSGDHHRLLRSGDHHRLLRSGDHHRRNGSCDHHQLIAFEDDRQVRTFDDHLTKASRQKHGGSGSFVHRDSSGLSLDELDCHSAFVNSGGNLTSEYQNNRTESCKSESIRAFRKHPSTGSNQDQDRGYQVSGNGLLSHEAQHNLERMFRSCADLTQLLPASPPPPPASLRGEVLTRDSDPVFQDFQEPHRAASFCGKFHQLSHDESTVNSPVARGHRQDSRSKLGPHSRTVKKSGSARLVQRVPESPLQVSRSQQVIKENPEKKQQRRRQAEENIGKMEELQLEGLRQGGSFGVGQPRPRPRRMSMLG